MFSLVCPSVCLFTLTNLLGTFDGIQLSHLALECLWAKYLSVKSRIIGLVTLIMTQRPHITLPRDIVIHRHILSQYFYSHFRSYCFYTTIQLFITMLVLFLYTILLFWIVRFQFHPFTCFTTNWSCLVSSYRLKWKTKNVLTVFCKNVVKRVR